MYVGPYSENQTPSYQDMVLGRATAQYNFHPAFNPLEVHVIGTTTTESANLWGFPSDNKKVIVEYVRIENIEAYNSAENKDKQQYVMKTPLEMAKDTNLAILENENGIKSLATIKYTWKEGTQGIVVQEPYPWAKMALDYQRSQFTAMAPTGLPPVENIQEIERRSAIVAGFYLAQQSRLEKTGEAYDKDYKKKGGYSPSETLYMLLNGVNTSQSNENTSNGVLYSPSAQLKVDGGTVSRTSYSAMNQSLISQQQTNQAKKGSSQLNPVSLNTSDATRKFSGPQITPPQDSTSKMQNGWVNTIYGPMKVEEIGVDFSKKDNAKRKTDSTKSGLENRFDPKQAAEEEFEDERQKSQTARTKKLTSNQSSQRSSNSTKAVHYPLSSGTEYGSKELGWNTDYGSTELGNSRVSSRGANMPELAKGVYWAAVCNVNRAKDDVFDASFNSPEKFQTEQRVDFSPDNQRTAFVFAWYDPETCSGSEAEEAARKAVTVYFEESWGSVTIAGSTTVEVEGLSSSPVSSASYYMKNVKQNNNGNYFEWVAGISGCDEYAENSLNPGDGQDASGSLTFQICPAATDPAPGDLESPPETEMEGFKGSVGIVVRPNKTTEMGYVAMRVNQVPMVEQVKQVDVVSKVRSVDKVEQVARIYIPEGSVDANANSGMVAHDGQNVYKRIRPITMTPDKDYYISVEYVNDVNGIQGDTYGSQAYESTSSIPLLETNKERFSARSFSTEKTPAEYASSATNLSAGETGYLSGSNVNVVEKGVLTIQPRESGVALTGPGTNYSAQGTVARQTQVSFNDEFYDLSDPTGATEVTIRCIPEEYGVYACLHDKRVWEFMGSEEWADPVNQLYKGNQEVAAGMLDAETWGEPAEYIITVKSTIYEEYAVDNKLFRSGDLKTGGTVYMYHSKRRQYMHENDGTTPESVNPGETIPSGSFYAGKITFVITADSGPLSGEGLTIVREGAIKSYGYTSDGDGNNLEWDNMTGTACLDFTIDWVTGEIDTSKW